MYREIVVRVYGQDAIEKVDDLRKAGIDFTDLVHSAVMAFDVEKERYMLT